MRFAIGSVCSVMSPSRVRSTPSPAPRQVVAVPTRAWSECACVMTARATGRQGSM
jgi:hypothetical protein